MLSEALEHGAVDLRHRFGSNLRHVRKAGGLSQDDLSDISGVHRNQISDYERGKKEPRMEALVKLAMAMGISTDEFWVGVGWQTEPPRLDVEEPRPKQAD